MLDTSLCIHKVLVVKGKKGLFITFPNNGNQKSVNDVKRYTDIVHPINNELRQYMQKEILVKEMNDNERKGKNLQRSMVGFGSSTRLASLPYILISNK